MISYGGPYDGRMTRISRDGYPEQVCIECGCSVIGATEIVQHNEFHNNYVRRDTSMGTAAWCDPGSHAYKPMTPERLADRDATIAYLLGRGREPRGSHVSNPAVAAEIYDELVAPLVEMVRERDRKIARVEALAADLETKPTRAWWDEAAARKVRVALASGDEVQP